VIDTEIHYHSKYFIVKSYLITILGCGLLFGACTNNADTAISSDKKESKDSAETAHLAKEARNRKIVQESMEALNKHDVDGVLKDASDEIVDHYGSGGSAKGKDTVRKNYVVALETFGDQKGEDLKYFAQDDLVMVWGKWSGNWKKDVDGQKATGKSYTVNDMDIFKLSEDGKILEHYSVASGIAVAQQIGYKLK
jgi:predicted SnoaL-like aldol condensation-catalyzing enzyme